MLRDFGKQYFKLNVTDNTLEQQSNAGVAGDANSRALEVTVTNARGEVLATPELKLNLICKVSEEEIYLTEGVYEDNGTYTLPYPSEIFNKAQRVKCMVQLVDHESNQVMFTKKFTRVIDEGFFAFEGGDSIAIDFALVMDFANTYEEKMKALQELVDDETVEMVEQSLKILEEFNLNATVQLDKFNENAIEKTDTYNTNASNLEKAYNNNAKNSLEEYNNNAKDKIDAYNINTKDKVENLNTVASTSLEEYNANASKKVEEYNSNTEDKTDVYNANATEKINEYDTNAKGKLEAYNSNTVEKLEAFNVNAQAKTEELDKHLADGVTTFDEGVQGKIDEYNANATEKVKEYNDNSVAKVEEYNTNTVTKNTELDAKVVEIKEDLNNTLDPYAKKVDLDKKSDKDHNHAGQLLFKQGITGKHMYYKLATIIRKLDASDSEIRMELIGRTSKINTIRFRWLGGLGAEVYDFEADYDTNCWIYMRDSKTYELYTKNINQSVWQPYSVLNADYEANRYEIKFHGMVGVDEIPEGSIKAIRKDKWVTKSQLMAEVNILNGKINDKIIEQDKKYVTKAQYAKLVGKERKLETLAGLILEELRKSNPDIGPIDVNKLLEVENEEK